MPTEKELLSLCLRWILDPKGNDFDRAMLIEAVQAKLQPRPWVGLTDKDIEVLLEDRTIIGLYGLSYAVEKILKEKNS
jgi:hypothetical protein